MSNPSRNTVFRMWELIYVHLLQVKYCTSSSWFTTKNQQHFHLYRERMIKGQKSNKCTWCDQYICKHGQAGFSPIRLLFSCVLQSNFLWTFRVLSFSIKNQLKEQFNSWNITMSKWKVNWPDMNNTYWKTLIRSNYKHGNFVLCYKSKVISMCTVYYPQIRIQSWLRKWPEIQTWNFA